jgi:hypothetical protein
MLSTKSTAGVVFVAGTLLCVVASLWARGTLPLSATSMGLVILIGAGAVVVPSAVLVFRTVRTLLLKEPPRTRED